MEASAVCVEVGAARILVAAGVRVVLLVPDPSATGRALRDLRTAGPGGVAAFVGDPADDRDRDAAIAMASEQFGSGAVLVRSAEEALALLGVPGPLAPPGSQPKF